MKRRKPTIVIAFAASALLLIGCEGMSGDPHAKPSDAPYAADPHPEPETPRPEPEPDPEAGRIDAYAHECLGITEMGSDYYGPINTYHVWENLCAYEVIVFFCQDSYTGTANDPPVGSPWTDGGRDCGTPGPAPADSIIFYGPSQPFYNRAKSLHAAGSAYGSTWHINVGQEFMEDQRGLVKFDVTYRYAVCRADTEAYYRSYLPELTSDSDGNYECWIDRDE